MTESAAITHHRVTQSYEKKKNVSEVADAEQVGKIDTPCKRRSVAGSTGGTVEEYGSVKRVHTQSRKEDKHL